MNKFKFIIYTQFKEILHNWRFNVIVICSLIFSFIFVIIFIGKIISISDTKKLANLKNISNSVLVSTGDSAFSEQLTNLVNSLDYDTSTHIVTKEISFTFVNKEQIENISIVDYNVGYFHEIQGLDFDKLKKNKIAISEYLSRKYHIKVGDTIVISDDSFKVISIFKSYEFEKRFLVSAEYVPEKWNSANVLNSQYFLHLINRKSIVKFEELQNSDSLLNDIVMLTLNQKNRLSMSSLNGYMLFVFAFSLIFIFLSLTNCLLVFEGKLVNLLKVLAIKKLCGLQNTDVILGLISENNLLCLFSLHLALAIVYLFNPYLPLFFTYTIQWESYLLTLMVVLAMMSVYSVFLYFKLNKYTLVNLLKGEV